MLLSYADAMVLSIFQLLRNINPGMQIITELILPQNMAYLAPMAPLSCVSKRQQVLLSPAFISGSVFMTQMIDDLMLASYCNNATDRILLQLLHRWHLSSGEGLHAQLMQLKLQLERHSVPGGEQQRQQVTHVQQEQQQKVQQQQQQHGVEDVENGVPDQSKGGTAAAAEQQPRRGVRFAEDVGLSGQHSGVAAGRTSPGPPTILQVRQAYKPCTCSRLNCKQPL